jgi:gas vesicle protein
MARVHHRKARKDYPEHGIKKGDMYYFAQIKTGPRSSRTLRSLTPFKRSQLTTSEYLSQAYDIEDDLQNVGGIEDAREIAERLTSLGEETMEKYDNMPEGLQEGETGQLLYERAESCQFAAEEIEEIIGEWETVHDEYQTALQTYEGAKAALDEQVDAEEADYEALDEALDEAEEPDEDEFLQRISDVSFET